MGYLSDNYDPSLETEATIEAIHALNREMIVAGARKFACGLSAQTTTLRAQPNGDELITDGPYSEAKELVGDLSILESADLDEALAWARKGAIVSRAAVEVREIFFRPPRLGPEQYGNISSCALVRARAHRRARRRPCGGTLSVHRVRAGPSRAFSRWSAPDLAQRPVTGAGFRGPMGSEARSSGAPSASCRIRPG